MNVLEHDTHALVTPEDVVGARQKVRAWATQMKFGVVDQTKIVTAASELGRNTVIYGGGGLMRIEKIERNDRLGLRLIFEDHGPGIPDITLAMTDGWTSGSGLGLGLSGARRLSDEFELVTHPGEGTRITITRWK